MKISIKELEVWLDEDYCLKAVESDGDALQFVHKDFWGLFKRLIADL